MKYSAFIALEKQRKVLIKGTATLALFHWHNAIAVLLSLRNAIIMRARVESLSGGKNIALVTTLFTLRIQAQ